MNSNTVRRMEPRKNHSGGIVYADADSSDSSEGGPGLLELQQMKRQSSKPADEKNLTAERKSASSDTRRSSQASKKLFSLNDQN